MLRLVKDAESIPAGVWCGGSGLLFCLLPPRQSALKESTEAEENDAIDFCLAARSTWFAGHTEAARSWRAGPKEEQTHRQRDAFHRAETYRSAFIIREYFIFCSASLQRRISSFEKRGAILLNFTIFGNVAIRLNRRLHHSMKFLFRKDFYVNLLKFLFQNGGAFF